jgi:3-dehydroquinate synthetase
MVIETLAAERLGLGAPGVSGRVRVLLDRLGLPTEVSVEELAQAWPLVSQDKKRMRSSVALPLARSIGDSVVEPVLLHELARGCGVALG